MTHQLYRGIVIAVGGSGPFEVRVSCRDTAVMLHHVGGFDSPADALQAGGALARRYLNPPDAAPGFSPCPKCGGVPMTGRNGIWTCEKCGKPRE